MAKDNGHNSLPSVTIGEVWGYCRDNLRGTTPLAQEQIECLQRDFLAPSKAHIRRLKRVRPFVLRPKPPIQVDQTHRTAFNDAFHAGKEVKRMALRAAHGLPLIQAPKPLPAPVRVDYTRNATVPPSRDEWDIEAIEANIARLAREAEQARADAERVKHA